MYTVRIGDPPMGTTDKDHYGASRQRSAGEGPDERDEVAQWDIQEGGTFDFPSEHSVINILDKYD